MRAGLIAVLVQGGDGQPKDQLNGRLRLILNPLDARPGRHRVLTPSRACAACTTRSAVKPSSFITTSPVAHCRRGLSKLYRRTGKRQEAQEHLTTATTMYREMGMTYWLEQAEAEQRDTALLQ